MSDDDGVTLPCGLVNAVKTGWMAAYGVLDHGRLNDVLNGVLRGAVWVSVHEPSPPISCEL